MKRGQLRATHRASCFPKARRLRLVSGVGVLTLVLTLWLLSKRVSTQRQPTRRTPAREPSFWQASTYGVSEAHTPLLVQDSKAEAAVTLGSKGVQVPLSVALDSTTPLQPGEKASNKSQQPMTQEMLILVAVTSTCCTLQAQQHRNAIRQSWGMTLASSTKPLPVELIFVLAQPSSSALIDAHKLLQDEMQHQDILFVRNNETYKSLPQKTVNIMRYASSATPRYSHVLKTDDDCYVRVGKLVELIKRSERDAEGMLYIGRQENPHGFFPIRDPASKWYIPFYDMPDADVPWKTRYLSGWGYLLSQDAVQLIVSRVEMYEEQPAKAPGWFAPLHWEDVLVGLLLHGYAQPQTRDDSFRAAWDSCNAGAVVKHMDVEALDVFPMLYAQEQSGAWAVQTVNCQVGAYSPGDYWSWKHWRDTLADVLRV